MTDTTPALSIPAGPRTPAGPPRPQQRSWNPQRGSAMPYRRYARSGPRVVEAATAGRAWPARSLLGAPLWASVDLRDGNQALVNPMDPARKSLMFDLLVGMGFKEIEVGYPSASDADFSFVRALVEDDRVPDDVTISVFTPARTELIDRTFDALAGARRAMVHLCNATACLWRETVFGLTADETREMALTAAEHVARRADARGVGSLRFEYSPETFNVTEPEFALEVSNAVIGTWEASPDRPVTVNLPTTVETDTPNVFADQVEWMHRNLDRRESVILSVHPHNDRGTAVASAELAVLAGADRVEGTLFGNGERTGNVCLVTLALNLFSQGIDPQLDLSDIDSVRRTVELANQMPVPARHPYAGELVYTAFSGTHQDAVAKGLAAMQRRAAVSGRPVADVPWDVPYLPVDPRDVGRDYESVVRVNSQSGKGGVAHVLQASLGLDLPRPLRVEFAREVQQVTDARGTELTSRELNALFCDRYVEPGAPRLVLKDVAITDAGAEAAGELSADVLLVQPDGREQRLSGRGPHAAAALLAALAPICGEVALTEFTSHPLPDRLDVRHAAYARIDVDGSTWWGVAVADDEHSAGNEAVTCAVDRFRAG